MRVISENTTSILKYIVHMYILMVVVDNPISICQETVQMSIGM